MLYRLFADIVVCLHLAFIVFVVTGALLALKWRRIAWVHIPSAVWGMLTEFFGLWCPLTPMENWLRLNGGGARYEASFIEHYIMPIIYPTELTRGLQIAFGALVLVINGAVYWTLGRRWLGRRDRCDGATRSGTAISRTAKERTERD
jgi:hypothetical protein